MTKILIVDDNDQSRILMREILRYHGYEVSEASNGSEGIDRLREISPDLMLLDLQMPVMDGYAALSKIREDPGTRNVRIIAVTSFTMRGDKEKILQSGFDGYIAKPIDTREFPEIIKKHLSQARPDQNLRR